MWGVALLATGGIAVDTPWGRVSSRAAVRPLIASGLLLLIYITRWRSHWAEDRGPFEDPRLARMLGIVAVLLPGVVGIGWGTRVAGGPDASAYISQSTLLARGESVVPVAAWARDAPWDNAPLLAAPVGYTPGRIPDRLAPVVSPGLPLLMAVAQWIGGMAAVFYVVPLLGAIAVWVTWRLGAAAGGAWAGAAAAWLVAVSPAFVVMLVQPMSDVPAAAFWGLALLAAWNGRPMGSGLATAMAILIRPNVALLALAPFVLLLLDRPRGAWTRVALFAAIVASACAAVGGLNSYHHGAPLQSGYGSLGSLYDASRIGANLDRYWNWFLASHTAAPLAGVLAPLWVSRSLARWQLLVVATLVPAAVLVLYAPYFTFPEPEWQYLRFLLPAYPPLMVGFAVVATAMARRRSVVWTTVAVALVLIVIAWSVDFARTSGAYDVKSTDMRYARAVQYVDRLPARSIIVSRAHSGTVHFYTGRDVLRFDALAPGQLDAVVSYLRDRGYGVCLVGDDLEIGLFGELAQGTSTGALLDKALGVEVGGAAVYTLVRAATP